MARTDLTRRAAFATATALMISATVAGAGATGPALAAGAPTLDQVIARNTEARGGAAALDRVKAIAVDVDIAEGGQTIQGRYIADTSGLVRIDIYVKGKHVYSEGVDSAGVWLWDPSEPAAKPSVAEGAANALIHGAEMHLYGLHRFAGRGQKLRLIPSQTIDGVAWPVVEVIFNTGHVSYFYFDPKTWLVGRRRDERAYHPDNDLTKIKVESRSLDYVMIDGVRAAHKNEDYDLASGKLLASNVVTRRTINPQIALSRFDRATRAAPTTD